MKLWFRRVLNLLLYLTFCLLAGSGLLLAYRLPPGSRGGRGLSLLDMGRHEWGDIHLYAGLFFLALVIIHLVMSWGWLKRIAADRRIWPVILGLLLGIGLIGSFFAIPVRHGSGYGSNRQHSEEH